MAVDKSENFAEKDDSEFCNCNVIHEDVVNYVRSGMLEQTQFEKLSMFFKAISDETRIKIPTRCHAQRCVYVTSPPCSE